MTVKGASSIAILGLIVALGISLLSCYATLRQFLAGRPAGTVALWELAAFPLLYLDKWILYVTLLAFFVTLRSKLSQIEFDDFLSRTPPRDE